MGVDKTVLTLVKNVSPEERNAIISFLQTSRNDPQTLLLLGMFRDIYMFRQMMNATVLSYTEKIRELETRLLKLEDKETTD